MSKNDPAERTVRDIRRKTRKQYTAEEKIRIVVSGLRGEESIAALCRREGIAESLYYSWSKEFLEAAKRRLSGDTARQASSGEVKDLRREMHDLKEALAEQVLENRLLKKNMLGLLTRLRQLGPLTDDNLLILRDRTPKGRHYTERPGDPRRGFKTAASARAASAMPSRADAGVVRGPRSAEYGAPAPSGARRRSAHGGRASGWRRTSRRWREG